jgi:hypothetical protein
MSETLTYKYYQLKSGTETHQTVLDWLAYIETVKQNTLHPMRHAQLPQIAHVTEKLGYNERVTAKHQQYGLSYVYPTIRQSPTEGSTDFIMICPVGMKADRSMGHFAPKDGIELDLGISALVLHGGKIVFERTPIQLDDPPEPSIPQL